MKTALNFDIEPWDIPKEILGSSGYAKYRFVLTDLSPETLAALCDEFRANVFKEAGKEPPLEDRAAAADNYLQQLSDVLVDFPKGGMYSPVESARRLLAAARANLRS